MDAPIVGLILDSSAVIAAERRGHTVRQILEQLKSVHGETEMGLSVVTIVEMVHGIQRTKDENRRVRREAFINELIRDIPIHPVTLEIAMRAGGIEGERAAQGVTIPFEDLLIGVTALHFGFAVATSNVRHFRAIPQLVVVPS